jgi:hypothetical protein
MKIFEVRVDLTRQKKQYESDKVGVSAILDEGEDVYEVISSMKSICLGQYSDKKGTSVSKSEVKVEEKKAVEKKVEAEKATPKKETVSVEREKATPPVKEVVKKKAPSKKTAKNIEYDRSNDLHKKHVGVLLDKKFPSWRKDPKVHAAAVETSKTLAGKPFMSSKGDILPEFTEGLYKSVEDALHA